MFQGVTQNAILINILASQASLYLSLSINICISVLVESYMSRLIEARDVGLGVHIWNTGFYRGLTRVAVSPHSP